MDFTELRLCEVGLMLDPFRGKEQEALVSEFMMSFGMRMPVKSIPCDDSALQGGAVMRRPLLSCKEAFVCARSYGLALNKTFFKGRPIFYFSPMPQ